MRRYSSRANCWGPADDPLTYPILIAEVKELSMRRRPSVRPSIRALPYAGLLRMRGLLPMPGRRR